MNNNKLPAFERLMIFTMSFTIGVLLYRCIFSLSFHYVFLLWNLFLAITPYLVSKQLKKCNGLGLKAVLLLSAWLLLFPNSPYILTDIFHFRQKDNIPFWYDLLLYFSAAVNGLLPGLVSLMKVESFLTTQLKPFWVKCSILFCLFSSGYGVYLGRFLRFNSWDSITGTKKLLFVSEQSVIMPQEHIHLWIFTIIFGIFLGIIYYTFKKIPALVRQPKK